MFEQELYVRMNNSIEASNLDKSDVEFLKNYLEKNKNSRDYSINLNFFYGDEGSKELNYNTFGMMKNGGFEYANYVALEMKKGN